MMIFFVVFCLVSTEGLRLVAPPESGQPTLPPLTYVSATKDTAELPRIYGEGPQILGLQNCAAYREQNLNTMEIAGMPNSGTNALWRTLFNNCIVPNEIASKYPENHNIQWQASFGKHQYLHTGKVENKDSGMRYYGKHWRPMSKEKLIVTLVKDPVQWMASSCRMSYFPLFNRNTDTCPSPVSQVTGQYFADSTRKTLPKMWADYYGEYFQNNDRDITISNRRGGGQPALMVRFEDLLFKPEETVAQVCGCLGYESKRGEDFQILESASKWGPGHEKASNRTQTQEQYTLKRSALLAHLSNEDKELMKKTFEESNADPILKKFHYDWSNPGLALYKTLNGKSKAEIEQLLASQDWGDEDGERLSDQEMSNQEMSNPTQ